MIVLIVLLECIAITALINFRTALEVFHVKEANRPLQVEIQLQIVQLVVIAQQAKESCFVRQEDTVLPPNWILLQVLALLDMSARKEL